jgi:hypothetical protein
MSFAVVEEINNALEDLKCEQPEAWEDVDFIHFFSDVEFVVQAEYGEDFVYLDILEKLVLKFLRQHTIGTDDGSDVEFNRDYDNGCLVDECTGVV